MIEKNNCLSILVNMEDRGINIDAPMRELVTSKAVPINVLKFIVEHQGLEVSNFYEMLRKKHNENKSPLYTNILKCETSNQDPITSLTCLLLQIVLYSNKLENADTFLSEVRAEEISRVINNYFVSGDTSDSWALLKLIKTDLLVVEALAGRREFD